MISLFDLPTAPAPVPLPIFRLDDLGRESASRDAGERQSTDRDGAGTASAGRIAAAAGRAPAAAGPAAAASDVAGLDAAGRGRERGVALLEFFAVGERGVGATRPTAEGGRGEPGTEGAGIEAERRAHQTRVMIDAARAETAAETRRICEAEFRERLAAEASAERARAERLAAEFARDRQRFFAAAEVQVVKLALTIARRVLAAEVRANELHLVPVAQSALARIKDGSATVLRVPSAEAEAWGRVWSGAGETRVTVAPDDRLGAGECVLETVVGRVELGVEAQMEEIERGFAELIERPGS